MITGGSYADNVLSLTKQGGGSVDIPFEIETELPQYVSPTWGGRTGTLTSGSIDAGSGTMYRVKWGGTVDYMSPFVDGGLICSSLVIYDPDNMEIDTTYTDASYKVYSANKYMPRYTSDEMNFYALDASGEYYSSGDDMYIKATNCLALGTRSMYIDRKYDVIFRLHRGASFATVEAKTNQTFYGDSNSIVNFYLTPDSKVSMHGTDPGF